MIIQIISLFAGVAVIAILVSMIRNPIIFKIGYRNIYRRKSDTFLVIMGSLIGTALIMGSMAMNDSFQNFLYGQIERTHGEIDELIYIPSDNQNIGKELIPNSKIEILVDSLLKNEQVDGVLPILSRTVSIGLPGEARSQTGKSFQVSMIGVEADQLSNWPDVDKVDLVLPSATDELPEVVINKELAEVAGVAVGDTLEILVDPGQRLLFWIPLPEVRVAEIVEGNGILHYQIENQGSNGFTMLMDVEEAREVLKIGVEDYYNALIVSNSGDFLTGERLTDQVVASIKPLVGEEVVVREVKKDSLSMVDQGNIGLLFLMLSVFAIFAGVLLLTNIYLMLAQERRTELGTLRAIGYSRKRVSRTILYEGFFYSIFSSGIGVLAGLGIARFILGSFVNLFEDAVSLIPFEGANIAFNSMQNSFVFFVRIDSIAYGFLLGLIIPMIIIVYTGRKISRTNIVTAVRNIPEELDERKRLLLNVIAAVGVLVSVVMAYSGYSLGNATGFFTGVMLAGLLIPVAIPMKNKRWIESFFSIAVIVFTMFSNSFDLIASNSGSSIYLTIAKGAAILFAGLFLIVYNLKTFEYLLNKLFQKARAAAPVFKISIAFSARNRLRTGLTIAMFAVVIFVITLISIIPYSMEQMLVKSRDAIFAGFDVGAFSFTGESAITFTELKSQLEVREISTVSGINVALRRDGRYDVEQVFALDDNFIDYNRMTELDFVEGLGISDVKDLWNYLRDNSGTVIVSNSVLPDVRPGDVLELRRIADQSDTGNGAAAFTQKKLSSEMIDSGPIYLEVIATIPENTISFLNGLLIYIGNTPAELTGSSAARHFLFNLSGDTEVEKKANFDSLQDKISSRSPFLLYVDDIMNLTSTMLQGTISILRSFLYFGMLVGIVGIAIIMFKALHERKRIIGMLKAIGFTKAMVFSSFLLETSFIAIIGILLGMVTGTLTSVEIFASPLMEGMKLYIPWDQLISMALIFYIASLVSTIIPSYSASKIAPAEALRYFE
ncbi:FtsX-like permease family protein [Mesotoga sp. H07.pep.5.3]|uniref:FtsX-like permease family protein n=1 Tax=Mesotoga sp. H07.pep.5.3 TaxID=1421003 RepID=UPI000C187AE0|nr:FtsX-like permease family protein [Mesotoga sp. H07.pep.5.3]PIJ60580.1 lipoprotein release ABC transporter permease [Mesotoga sp. H07.pep.5.3]